MKKVLILTIGMVVFITGCMQSNKAENHLTNNINVYKSAWENVFNQMDIDVLNNSNLHQDAKFLNMKGEVAADGFEAFKNYYNGYIVGFPDAEFTIIDIFGQGDKLVKHWNFKGTHAEIGKKVVLLTMENPLQVFRMFRADEMIIIAAVEGERWERVEAPQD